MSWSGWTLGVGRIGIREVCDLPISAEDRLRLLFSGPRAVIAPALERIVERAVRDYALPCPQAKAWARCWLSAEDRSAMTASAEMWARDERTPAARWAAGAAKYAADAKFFAASLFAIAAAAAGAADGAEVKDREAERERQLDDFRALEAAP